MKKWRELSGEGRQRRVFNIALTTAVFVAVLLFGYLVYLLSMTATPDKADFKKQPVDKWATHVEL